MQLRKHYPLKLHLINQSRRRQFLLQIHHQMHPSSGTITMSTAHFIPESAEVDDTYFSNTYLSETPLQKDLKNFPGLDTPTYYEGRGMTVERVFTE